MTGIVYQNPEKTLTMKEYIYQKKPDYRFILNYVLQGLYEDICPQCKKRIKDNNYKKNTVIKPCNNITKEKEIYEYSGCKCFEYDENYLDDY